MKANEYFREYGLVESKRHLEWMVRVGARQDIHGWFMDDLKRLVESHELVESFKCKRYSGLSNAKDHLITLAHIEDHAELDRLGRAIADVESCQ